MRAVLAILVISASLLAVTARADETNIDAVARALGVAHTGAKVLDDAYSASVRTAPLPSGDNTIDLGSAAKAYKSVYVDTAVVYGIGANAQLAVYVPTMAATPVAGTNMIVPGLNIVPTAAANTAAFIGAATPVVGQQFVVVNNSGATVRLKASGGATLNGATAGGYIGVASLATVRCTTVSATNQTCEQPVIPTPIAP
jgi:hypothetical protein